MSTLSQVGRAGLGPLHTLRHGLGKIGAASNLFHSHVRYVPRVGLGAAWTLFLAEASERRPVSRLVRPMVPELLTITPASYKYPLTMRRADTDAAVVRQVLALEEYREVSSLDGIHLIVDCGANIGVSAYYFLHHYPHSRLIAIEPDERNCNLCRRNLEPFGARAIVLQAAVWSEARPLRIAPSSRTRGSWAFRVEPASAQTADVEGLTIHGILERAGLQGPIDLLKIDIEGAELEVFRQSPAWLETVRNIAVELHSPAARQAFLAALAPYDHTMNESGESTIVRDLRRRPPSPTRG